MGNYSGATGFCHKKGHSIGVIITWNDDNEIIDIDCDHSSCGHSHICKLYQDHRAVIRPSNPERGIIASD